jgi:hypothetical protein
MWLVSRDTGGLFYVGKRWFWDAVLAGRFPLWNENLYAGYSPFTSPSFGILSPVSALFYLVFPNFLAEQLQLPFFAILGAWGMWLWVKKFSNEHAALLIALSFGLCGPLVSLADRSHIFYSVCLYPWAMWFGSDLLAEGRKSRLPGLVIVLALMMIHADWVAFLLAVLALAVLAWPFGLSRVLLAFGAGAWALALSALAVVPVFWNLSQSARAGGYSFEQTSYYSLHPLRLFNLIVPEAWGQIYNGDFYGEAVSNAYMVSRFWYHSIFVGTPVLILALLGVPALLKRKGGWIYLTAGVAFILIAFGHHFPLHEGLYHWLPKYSGLRYPEKFVLYSLFMMFPLAGLASTRIKSWVPLFFAIAGIHLLALILPLLWSDFADHAAVLMLLAHSAAFVYCLIWALVLRKTEMPYALPALTVLAAFELLVFIPGFHVAPKAVYAEAFPFAEKMTEGRYLRDARLDGYTDNHFRKTLVPNWQVLVGLKEVFGYETNNPLRLEMLNGHEVFDNLPAWAPALNLTHVLSTIEPREENLKKLAERGLVEPLAMDEELNMVLLKIKRTSKEYSLICKAQFVSGPDQALEFVRARVGTLEPLAVEGFGEMTTGECGSSEIVRTAYSPEKRRYTVRSDSPIWLVERESYDSGWRARVDGVEAKILPADFAGRAILIGAGQHEVEFSYRPRWFAVSVTISILSTLILAVFFGWQIANKKRAPV